MLEKLHEVDTVIHGNSTLRLCDKLSDAHFHPTSFQKMSVKLAAQVSIGYNLYLNILSNKL